MCLESLLTGLAPGGPLSLPFALAIMVLSTYIIVKFTQETPNDPMYLCLEWPWEE